MTHTLIVAAGPGWAELAARHVAGDAVVHIGDPADFDSRAGDHHFDHVVLSGLLADERWLSSSFDVAARRLGAGGRATVIVADGDPDRPAGPDAAGATPLPAGVAGRWRVVGITMEHPVTAISLQRAADDDGATGTSDAFLRAQVVAHAYRHPEVPGLDHLAGDARPQPSPTRDPDAQLNDLRRELAAYKNSKLGRLTTRYWRIRRSVDQRIRAGRR